MSRFADTMESSPIHRGVFLAQVSLALPSGNPPKQSRLGTGSASEIDHVNAGPCKQARQRA